MRSFIRYTITFLGFSGLILRNSLTVMAVWSGLISIGGDPVFYDENQFEDRTPLTSRLKLRYSPENSDQWLFVSNIKLRTELVSQDDGKIQVQDLYARYGNGEQLVQVKAGIFSPDVSGTGDVIGACVQFNPGLFNKTGIGLGVFGGANAAMKESVTDTDGLRTGGYFSAKSQDWGQASISYVKVTDTDYINDERDYLAFNTNLRIGSNFDFYQAGEYIISSEADENGILTYYNANFVYVINAIFRLNLTYDEYDRMPSLESLSDDPERNPDNFDRFSAYRGQAIGPRVDIQIGDNWRTYIRYRYRKTDDSQKATWHQYLFGFACLDVLNAGISLNGSVFVNRGETKDYEAGFLTISRDFGSRLNMSINVATDRFSYMETVGSNPHIKSTYRIGLNGFYRLGRKTTILCEYERTFGEEKKDRDHRIMFNWQFRF